MSLQETLKNGEELEESSTVQATVEKVQLEKSPEDASAKEKSAEEKKPKRAPVKGILAETRVITESSDDA